MFQLCGLVVLCGFLATASSVEISTSQILGSIQQGLDGNNLLGQLGNLNLLNVLRPKGIVGSALGLLNKIIDVQITAVDQLPVDIRPSADGKEVSLRIPLDLKVAIKSTLIGQVVQANVHLVILAEAKYVCDELGCKLVVETCQQDSGSLNLRVLDGKLPFHVQHLVDNTLSLLSDKLPTLLLDAVCPIINNVLEGLNPGALMELLAYVVV